MPAPEDRIPENQITYTMSWTGWTGIIALARGGRIGWDAFRYIRQDSRGYDIPMELEASDETIWRKESQILHQLSVEL
ncbi:hypothetical protein DJ030_15920 [bacterium endosymbiont of Escarpia laminata]|nr:MAG: hypothetical protein DJ030_15920 [bacterium endosymbiont of Escarpia laminata]